MNVKALFLQRPRVCILGGGFGGLYTALRLESLVWPDDKKPQVMFLLVRFNLFAKYLCSEYIFECSYIDQVVLVDQSERFVFKPMLYELLSGGKFSFFILN